MLWPNHALQRTRHDAVVCNRGVPRAGSLSLGRSSANFTWSNAGTPRRWRPICARKTPLIFLAVFASLTHAA